MKPDRPGEWHSRDGRKVVVYVYDGDLKYREFIHNACSGNYLAASLPDGDWLPAVAPTFPALPPKPALVLFTQAGWGQGEKYWGALEDETVYVVSPKCGHGAVYPLGYAKIVVVPHPDNDPEAVRLIEAARK